MCAERRRKEQPDSVFYEVKISIKVYATAGAVNISRSHPLTKTNTTAAAVPTTVHNAKNWASIFSLWITLFKQSGMLPIP